MAIKKKKGGGREGTKQNHKQTTPPKKPWKIDNAYFCKIFWKKKKIKWWKAIYRLKSSASLAFPLPLQLVPCFSGLSGGCCTTSTLDHHSNGSQPAMARIDSWALNRKTVNFEVIMCWMPFLTCSCWGRSAHMVKVDEIFKVTEIYKVTLAGHAAWIFFFFLLDYRSSWERGYTVYWLPKENAVMLQQELLKDQNRTKTPQSSRANDWGRRRRKTGTIIHCLLYCAGSLSWLYPSLSPSLKRRESICKDAASLSGCCMPLDVGSSCGEHRNSLWPSD